MNVAELNRAIHRHGGDETVDGDDLKLTATQPLPAELLNKLRDHKARYLVLALLEIVDPHTTIATTNNQHYS